MKNISALKILLAVSSILLIAFFAGCEAQESTQTSSTPGTKQGTQIETVQPAATTASVISAADQAAYQGAQQLRDATFCDKIFDAKYKEQCKTDIADQLALNDALAKVDASLCAKISTKDKQEACKIQVEVIEKAKQNDLDAQAKIQAENDLFNKIIQAGDYKRCNEISDQNFMQSCEINILLALAIKENDATKCNLATVEAAKNTCNELFAQQQP